jgi:DNA invertase Pin-like site-specific DNA recombinase
MPARILRGPLIPDRAPKPIQAVLRARVSSKEQAEEGYSLASQVRILHDYGSSRGFAIAEEFVDAETSKTGDGNGFMRMVEYLKKHRETCRTILVEKTDRLYRNPKDWVTLDELDVEIHFVKENKVLSRNSRSSDKLAHGMTVVMAKHFIDNLSEETLKGMTEKARAGVYPSFAPVGYVNADGPCGKRIIIPDAETAPIISLIYECFATAQYSLRALVAELRANGITLRGKRLNSSLVHQILRKRLYAGEFDWNGITYQGIHEPLVTKDRWQRVQELLNVRAENKTRKVKHDFGFTGLVHCGHCGCLFVGELKKGKYVYYHCTGNRGKCPERYTREEILSSKFSNVLQELLIPEAILDWLREAVLTSDRTEQAARTEMVKRLRTRYDQIEARIGAMYWDKLDGRITQEFFDKQAVTLRREQDGLLRKIQDIEKATPAPIEQAIDMLRLTSRASELFLQQPAAEQRRLLQTLVKKAAWREGTLETTLFEPFEILRHSNRASAGKEKANPGSGRDLGIWLPR